MGTAWMGRFLDKCVCVCAWVVAWVGAWVVAWVGGWVVAWLN